LGEKGKGKEKKKPLNITLNGYVNKRTTKATKKTDARLGLGPS
jgi:hypothetical protein